MDKNIKALRNQIKELEERANAIQLPTIDNGNYTALIAAQNTLNSLNELKLAKEKALEKAKKDLGSIDELIKAVEEDGTRKKAQITEEERRRREAEQGDDTDTSDEGSSDDETYSAGSIVAAGNPIIPAAVATGVTGVRTLRAARNANLGVANTVTETNTAEPKSDDQVQNAASNNEATSNEDQKTASQPTVQLGENDVALAASAPVDEENGVNFAWLGALAALLAAAFTGLEAKRRTNANKNRINKD